MKRYYFYAPSKYRTNQKGHGIMSFDLKAFYSEQAFSDRAGKELATFKNMDGVSCMVNRKVHGQYRFSMDHGIDGCMGHFARSLKELQEDMEHWGYIPVDEKSYFRLRKLATKLLYKHTNFKAYWHGRNDYFYSNESCGSFYNFRLGSVHYHHNLKEQKLDFRKWMFKSNLPVNILEVTEEINIFMARNKGREKDHFHSYKFSLEGNRGLWLKKRKASVEDALYYIFGNKEVEQVSARQYERLRKIAKYLMWEHDELDISPLRKKQNYSVRILDI